MGFPTLKRENTVGIRFTKGKVEDPHYRAIIYHTLDVEDNKVFGMAAMGDKKFMLKLSTWGTYNRIVKDFVGREFIIGDDNEFEIDDLSTYKNRVRVTKVPFEMSDNELRKLLERYGKVENINTSFKKFADYKDIYSDERIVWMVVEFAIPSSLFIKDSETFMYFSYLQQPKTCHRCGSSFHTVSQCDVSANTKPKDRDNAVNLDIDDLTAPDPTGYNNINRSRQNSESSDGTDSEFEDSKSALTSESDTEDSVFTSGPTHPSQETHTNEDQSGNAMPATECVYPSAAEPGLESHTSRHTGETSESDRQTYSNVVKSPANILQSQFPVTMTRSSFISSSQPVTNSSDNNKKRNLSLSPQNIYLLQSKPKNAKVSAHGQLV